MVRMRRLPSLAQTARRMLSHPPLPVPLPAKKPHKTLLLQFLEAEAVKEEDRLNRQQAASEEEEFLQLFEELVRKE